MVVMSNVNITDYTFNDAVIMIVDDEPLIMDMLEACLEQKGYQFFIKIEDSRQAIAAIAIQRPDVVLLDLNMPNLDGFAILKILRSNLDTQFLSVIALTSSNDSATKLQALELGATDFLAKPIDPSELFLRLKNTLTVKAYQEQLAYYDTLTKLPNRKLFLDRLEWSLSHAAREKTEVAVLNVAIDRFQQVNDLFGPQAGDQLLIEVAQRLMRCLRDTDTVSRAIPGAKWRNIARLSGDEFSVLLTDIPSVEKIVPVAERIKETMTEVFLLAGREIYITVSIGIATFPRDATDTDSLMKRAGAATAYAKKNGRNCHQFYSAEVNSISQRRMSLEQDLRRVMERNELSLVYQPKIGMKSRRVTGMEVLLRWHSPIYGEVSPFEFIPIAEETGMINEIGAWVLQHGAAQAAEWHRMGLTGLDLSVNVSAHQFRDNHFPNMVQQVLTTSGFNPEHLVVEITEGVLIGDRDRIGDLLFKIKMTGAQVSIDDFGTGYSSLSYLKSFPIDELKIDRSFIVDIPGDEDSAAIVRAIIAMARSLDLKIVAEGVETLEQLRFLEDNHCDTVQGFFYAKPLTPNEFWEFCQACEQVPLLGAEADEDL